MAAYEVLLLNTAVPQIQAAQAGDTYVVPRDMAVNAQMTVTGNVGIGTTSPDYKLQVSGTTGQTFSIERVASSIGSSTALGTIAGTGEIPTLTADGASIQFLGAGTWSSTSSPGRIVFNTTPAATTTPVERFQLAAGEAVFNDPGNDYDFRVESDTNTHALFVQGSDGFVGIGTSTPVQPLDVRAAQNGLARFYSTSAGGNAEIEFLTLNSASTVGKISKIVATQVGADTNGSILSFYTSPTTNNTPTERLRIDSSGNVSIGGTANRATTVGTKALNIFDGTAPVGTLANGISIYSSSGEAYVMDAAGNATLFSPHDAETNEWIFKSKHTPTGKVLKIDVERLLKFVNDHFGLDAVHEFIED